LSSSARFCLVRGAMVDIGPIERRGEGMKDILNVIEEDVVHKSLSV
jgi:hypothetical protein